MKVSLPHYSKKGERGQAHHKPAPISLYGQGDPTPHIAQSKLVGMHPQIYQRAQKPYQ